MSVNGVTQQPSFKGVYVKFDNAWSKITQTAEEVSATVVKNKYNAADSKEALSLNSENALAMIPWLRPLHAQGNIDLNILLTGKDAKVYAQTKVEELKLFFNKIFNGEYYLRNEPEVQKPNNMDEFF